MKEKSIENALFDYFYNHPEKDVDDLLDIADQAYAKAQVEIVPAFKPRIVESLESVSDEFDSRRTFVRKKEVKDESTNAYNGGFE